MSANRRRVAGDCAGRRCAGSSLSDRLPAGCRRRLSGVAELQRVVHVVQNGEIELGAGCEHVDGARADFLAPAAMVLEHPLEGFAPGDVELVDELVLVAANRFDMSG